MNKTKIELPGESTSECSSTSSEKKGETSAGKSTLINRILGKKIFIGRNHESTATVCKFRNSEKIQITVEHTSGEREVKDLTDKCDPETKEGEKILRDTLKSLTDMTSSRKSMHYRSVDIGFPIPFLKGNTILVDTPGIGGSGEVSKKLMEYLPNALSFVFVIDAGSAGGMQNDRLPEILRMLTELQIDNEMPCFDPKDVLFVTNKWDTVLNADSDSEDEDEQTKTWRALRKNLKHKWPSVKEKHIFKMSLKEVSVEKCNSSTEQFHEFRKELKSNIEKTENIRIIQHLRFSMELLETIQKGIKARLKLNKMSEEEQTDLFKSQQDKIKVLTNECEQVSGDLLKRMKENIEALAKECYDYMSTDFGKDRILNPSGLEPILEVPWSPTGFTEEIHSRVALFVHNFLNTDDHKEKFKKIQEETAQLYNNICSEISEMENDWTGEGNQDEEISQQLELNDISSGKVVGVVLATSPIWIPLLAVGVALTVGLGAVAIVLTPLLAPIMVFLGRRERLKKILDEEYDHCKSTICSRVCNLLEMSIGNVLKKLIVKVKCLCLRRIETLKKMTQQLLESRQEILAKKDLLLNLEQKVESMMENARRIE